MVMVNVIVTKVSNALCTLVPREQPGFQALFKKYIVLLCAQIETDRLFSLTGYIVNSQGGLLIFKQITGLV